MRDLFNYANRELDKWNASGVCHGMRGGVKILCTSANSAAGHSLARLEESKYKTPSTKVKTLTTVFPFRNVLFPTDFSAHAKAALKYAAAFARNGHGRVIVINAQDVKVPPNIITLPDSALGQYDGRWRLLRSESKALLTDQFLKGLEVEPVFVEGEPAPAIAQAAVDYGADLITVVTRGRNRFSRAFGGSIAEDIVAEAPCPVLAVKAGQHEFVEYQNGQTQLKLKRIVLATNFRPSSVTATKLATQIANRMGAELHAVYVIGDYFEQISAMFPEGGLAALTRLRSYVGERMSHLANTVGRHAITHIAEGRPYEEVVKVAAVTEADLIVIGTAVHNSLFGGSAVLGSEVERVIRNAPCPVLCVPASRVVTPLPALIAQPATG